MIRKSVERFSEEIMRQQKAEARWQFDLKPSRFSRELCPDDSSIDQPAADRGQETVVENVRGGGTLVKLEVLADLADRTLQPSRIDAAEAVVPDFAGQD